ncbi:catalase [Zoogloea sp.]|uniref:catalase n=1 Tax=Zoogloea sp. TaxID=49181 RepID=UPI0037D9D0D1
MRGPTLLEDFILREKITHFDHERIPERIVHARGSATHGYFEAYKPLTEFTLAAGSPTSPTRSAAAARSRPGRRVSCLSRKPSKATSCVARPRSLLTITPRPPCSMRARPRSIRPTSSAASALN